MAEDRYFEEARSWYSKLYHAPMAERSYMIVITVIAIYMIWLSLTTAASLIADFSRPVPFVVRSFNISEEVPLIRPIAAPGENINDALVRYFLSHYVQMRESFSFSNVELRENSVQSMSAPNVFQDYSALMAADNPRSPKYIFSRSRNANRTVDILSVHSQRKQEPYTATVLYRVNTNDGKGNIQPVEWSADIKFNYKNLVVHKDGNVDQMKFSVTAYSAKQRIVDQP